MPSCQGCQEEHLLPHIDTTADEESMHWPRHILKRVKQSINDIIDFVANSAKFGFCSLINHLLI
jgi:hypothetical protein